MFNQFCEERGIKNETIKGYKNSIKKYTEYYDMSLNDLLNEAIEEEDNNIKKRKRTIKQRLLQFRTHLATKTDIAPSTITAHMRRITTLYTHFDVYVPKLPPLKMEDKVQTTFFDLPTKKHISMACEIAGIRISSLILVMSSSGTGRKECAKMTIGDFITGCQQYYSDETETLHDILLELDACEEPIIPTLYLKRIKTGKYYYTFISPEASRAIIDWLLLRWDMNEQQKTENEDIYQELTMEDSLWDLTIRQITYHLSNINDELSLGFKGPYRFLRPHSLRKFHASNIGISKENIDLLQGRSRGAVHETYIKTNPEWLREIYINHMDNVMIGEERNREVVHEEYNININLNFYGKEYGVNL